MRIDSKYFQSLPDFKIIFGVSFILKVNQKGLISFAALHKRFENFDVISKSNSKLNSAVEQNGLI